MTDPQDSRPNHPDEELDALLAGKHPLSDAYKQSSHEHPTDDPSAELDARILAMAKAETSATAADANSKVVPLKQPRWLKPLAAAAMLVLCVGVVFRVSLDSEFGVEQEAATIFYEVEGDAAELAPSSADSAPEPAALNRQQPESEAFYSLEEAQSSPLPAAESKKATPNTPSTAQPKEKRESSAIRKERSAKQQPTASPGRMKAAPTQPPSQSPAMQSAPAAPPPAEALSESHSRDDSISQDSRKETPQTTNSGTSSGLSLDSAAGYSSPPAPSSMPSSNNYAAEPMHDEAHIIDEGRAPIPENQQQQFKDSTAWLDEIRAMIQAGDDEAATQALDDWQKAYPDLDLPKDIQQWKSTPDVSH